MRWLFCYVVLAELVLYLIANQRSSFIRCIGSSPIYYAHAVCPIGRGCCLENSLDVKVSGVQIPNMACVDEGFDQWLLLRSENSRK